MVFDDRGDLATLLSAPIAFVNERTAPLYALADVRGTALVKTPLDGKVRAGVLTQAAVLAVHAKPVETSLDAVGQHHPLDGKMRPIPARGSVVDSDIAGEVDGAAALVQRLAESRQVAACVARQWFRYAMGHVETAEEEALMAALGEEFRRGGARITELLVALTHTDSFLHR